MDAAGAIAENAESREQVHRSDLRRGDRVLVRTGNSSYTIWVLGDGLYWVWGGWFDRKGIAPHKIQINGCTWGGKALKPDVVAACGLRLEFSNRVRTTPIEEVRLVRSLWRAAAWGLVAAPLNRPETS